MLERYLRAIEFWLPAGQSRDILAEISEDLHSQIDEREEALGRQLNDAELAALIQRRGRPVAVANRYRAQQFLIGPVLFPIYAFVLKICLFCGVVPAFVVSLVVSRLQTPAGSWPDAVIAAVGSMLSAAFIGAGVVTMLFAALEQLESRTRFLEDWSPLRLPPARDPNSISRAGSTFELAVHFTVLTWWVSQASSLSLLGVRITFAPAWAYFFWGIAAVTLLNGALSAVNLWRPYWTGSRAIFRLCLDAAGSALFCWLLKADVVARLDIAGVAPERALEIARTVSVWMDRAFPFAAIALLAVLAGNSYRVVRVTRKGWARHEPVTQ